MSALAAFLLLPAALLLDRLLGEPPARVHPVCGMGALAAIMERVFRRGPNGARMTLAGLAACLAVVTAIACMHLSKTLHPPGGATALIAVMGGDNIRALGYGYVLAPCLAGALLMLGMALVVNNIPRNRRYPRYWW